GVSSSARAAEDEGAEMAPFYGACETIVKRAIVSCGGKVEERKSWGICSVFVAKQYRGRGYAGAMMRALGEICERMGDEGEKDEFSVLYSDIGPLFYERNGGWKAHSTEEVVLPVLRSEEHTSELQSRE